MIEIGSRVATAQENMESIFPDREFKCTTQGKRGSFLDLSYLPGLW